MTSQCRPDYADGSVSANPRRGRSRILASYTLIYLKLSYVCPKTLLFRNDDELEPTTLQTLTKQTKKKTEEIKNHYRLKFMHSQWQYIIQRMLHHTFLVKTALYPEGGGGGGGSTPANCREGS